MLSSPQSLALVLGFRLLTHSTNRFARFVTWVSFIGLALGVLVLTVVVTVMNGFDHELKSRLLSSIPHVTAPGAQSDADVAGRASDLEEVVAVYDYFQGLGAITVAGRVFPVSLYGIDARGVPTMTQFSQNMALGSLDDLMADAQGVVLGAPLARALRLSLGDTVMMVTAQADGSAVKPRILRFRLVGTFTLGADPDYNLALLNLSRFDAATWSGMGEIGLQIQLHDAMTARGVAMNLQPEFPETLFNSWELEYGELFQAVQLEKSMMFVLLLLVVAIASFNIIAGQTMLVNDKRRSIAILRTMGGKAGLVRRVFLLQGLCISLLGTFLGLVLGVLTAQYINEILGVVEGLSGMHLLDGSFFVEVPVRVLPADLVVIGLLSCGLCLLSAWFPARRAAQLDPVTALH